MRQAHVQKSTMIHEVYDDNAVAENMRSKFTLLNKMACTDPSVQIDESDEEYAEDEGDESCDHPEHADPESRYEVLGSAPRLR